MVSLCVKNFVVTLGVDFVVGSIVTSHVGIPVLLGELSRR